MKPMQTHSPADVAPASPVGDRTGLAWVFPVIGVFLIAILGLMLWQFGNASSAAAATPGLREYRQTGCAICHGQNGEGGAGPAMAGHVAQQVVRQVRAPLGPMPVFGTLELSDERLQLIVDYVLSLGAAEMGEMGEMGDQAPAHGGHGDAQDSGNSILDPRDVMIGHHWMAALAMRTGETDEAIAHLEKTLDLVAGEHLAVMERLIYRIQIGELDAAEERITEMLAGFAPEPEWVDELHLGLSIDALAVGDLNEASEHLEALQGSDHATAAAQAKQAIAENRIDYATNILLDALEPDDADEPDEHLDDADGHDE